MEKKNNQAESYMMPLRRPSEKRPVLIHYHIFKNAGTTIEFVLRHNFREGFTSLHGNSFNALVSEAELVELLDKNRALRAVSSHHLRPPKPEANGLAFHEVVILRHPIDRFLSMYDFYRRNQSLEDPLQTVAKDCDLKEFIEFLIQHYPHLINNLQVSFLACGAAKIPREPDLKRAIRMLPQFSVVGTTGQLDIVLVTAEFSLQPTFGRLDFSYASQNVNPERLPNLESRLQRARQDCGIETYERLLKLNKMDLELLNAADQEARVRFAAIADHDDELAHFRRRCNFRVNESITDPSQLLKIHLER